MIDIYLITNLVNNKQYVGKTQKGYLYRFKQHLSAYEHGERHYLACAIQKYGKDNFQVELIAQVEDDSWEFWEKYYIRTLHTHYSEGGYNITWGGDFNPMDDPSVVSKHSRICKSEYFRNLQRELSTGKTHSEETKELCRRKTLSNLEVCCRVFREYNLKRQIKVGMIVDDKIVRVFDSLADAGHFICDNSDKYVYNDATGSQIKQAADRYNKNGRRAKYLGCSWTLKV